MLPIVVLLVFQVILDGTFVQMTLIYLLIKTAMAVMWGDTYFGFFVDVGLFALFSFLIQITPRSLLRWVVVLLALLFVWYRSSLFIS